jgi:hypothetical protein
MLDAMVLAAVLEPCWRYRRGKSTSNTVCLHLVYFIKVPRFPVR